MKRKRSLKNENRGAALLAVLIIMVVVSAIAVIITKITLTNIQMKEVERSTKRSFYSAESVMDELYAGASAVSAKQMSEVYQKILVNYLAYQNSGKDLQKEFKRDYIAALEAYFSSGAAEQTKTNAAGEVLYRVSKYDVETLRDCIATDANKPCLSTQQTASQDDADYDADYEAGIYTLKNVKVQYTDSRGYETTITTDLVFSTPQMNFDGGDQIKEFMRYSLIADDQILVNAQNIKVNGNAYAGAGGINGATGGAGTFTGKTIVTRGDMVTDSNSTLTIGEGSSAVWAQNIRTKGKEASQIIVNGDCYVEDDLTLKGTGSSVTLKGNYYGYNFQKNYDAPTVTNDSRYSSAIMINGRNCRLDMQELNYLMLSGRTFISRGTDGANNDVMLGESLSVRTNQLAYFVPKEYVAADGKNFTEAGCQKFESETGISNLTSYLKAGQQVTAFYYQDMGSRTRTVNYYLNFANEQKANDYFSAYCSNGTKAYTLNGYASKYVSSDAIILDTNRIFTLKGDLMYRKPADTALSVKNTTIEASDWEQNGVYWDYVSQLAVRYKALELGLTEARAGVTASDVRITDADGDVDKTASPLFEELIDKTALQNKVSAIGTADAVTGNIVYVPVQEVLSDGVHERDVILVNNHGASDYVIPLHCTEGIVVATGNVKVDHAFKGLIISGNKIYFAANASVDADEMMVSGLFSDDMQKNDPLFSQFFREYATGAVTDHISGNVDLKTYLNYENWKKE